MKPQTKPSKHIVLVAGEESGDKLAAEIILSLKQQYTVHFSGLGGRHMQAAGAELVFNTANFATTGLALLNHLFKIRQAFKKIHQHLLSNKPDLLILLDYPEFNLRLAKFAKKHHIPVLYYISPQIWAWRSGRIKVIKECVDHMAVIFPFEKRIYEKANVPVSFVGHPLVKKVHPNPNPLATREVFRLPTNKRLIALLPGSRGNEIAHHMPVLVETAKRLNAQHDDLHFVIPVAGTLEVSCITQHLKDKTLPLSIIKDHAIEIASCSDCVIVASGTASLECALLEKPMCIIYKSNALAYFIACLVIKVQYFGLCNLLANRMIVPELLQYDCNAHELTLLVNNILLNTKPSQSITDKLHALNKTLAMDNIDKAIDVLVAEKAGLS